MIQPVTAQEARFVHNLAALLVRAHTQHQAKDRDGSKTLMASYRSLQEIGANTYRERNAGLVEYANLLAQEHPRSDRLVAFMQAQDERLEKGAAPMFEPTNESEYEYVKQLTDILVSADGLRKAGNETLATEHLAHLDAWETKGWELYGERAAGLLLLAHSNANAANAAAIITEQEHYPAPDISKLPPVPEAVAPAAPPVIVPPAPPVDEPVTEPVEPAVPPKKKVAKPKPKPKPAAKAPVDRMVKFDSTKTYASSIGKAPDVIKDVVAYDRPPEKKLEQKSEAKAPAKEPAKEPEKEPEKEPVRGPGRIVHDNPDTRFVVKGNVVRRDDKPPEKKVEQKPVPASSKPPEKKGA